MTSTKETAPFVVTVTLNPAIDLFLTVETLSPGQLHRIPVPVQHPGGKGINVSKMLHVFGVPTSTTGFLGGTRGAWIKDKLSASGIDSQFVEIEGETRINTKIVDSTGVLTELNSPAPQISETDWQSFSIRLTELSLTSKWIAFCGNLPANCPRDWYRLQIEAAKAHGVKTLLDASGDGLKQGVLAKPNIIKPNLHELEGLCGRPLSTKKDIISATTMLHESGIDMVIVSLGADGMIVTSSIGTIIAKVPKVPVVSSVGAGDTVVAAILYAIYSNLDFAEMVRFATAAGTASVTKTGTLRPQMSDIEKLVPEIHLEKWGQ